MKKENNMMWTRFELKERGKAAFQRNYWRSVLVAFILMLFVSGGGDTEPADTVCGLLKAMLISCSVQRAFLPR